MGRGDGGDDKGRKENSGHFSSSCLRLTGKPCPPNVDASRWVELRKSQQYTTLLYNTRLESTYITVFWFVWQVAGEYISTTNVESTLHLSYDVI